MEFFPISPTLTRIRVHKNITPQKEIVCYPVTVEHHPQSTFSANKRLAPSSSSPNIPTPPQIPPPSPPRRRSSRNNSTLRIVSSMKIKSEKSPSCKRHETCFTSSSNIDKTKVNYLRDRISCKLSPTLSRRSTSPKMNVIKKISTTPDSKNKIISTLTTTKDAKTSSRKVQSKTSIFTSGVCRSKSCDAVRNLSKSGRKTPSEENLAPPKTKTFGLEKKKFDFTTQTTKIAKSPELLFPTEVKKAVLSQSKSTGSLHKKLSTLKKPAEKADVPLSPKLTRRPSPCPSSASDKSKIETITSPKLGRKPKELTKLSRTKSKDGKGTPKTKKEQINDEIVKKDRTTYKLRKEKSKKSGHMVVQIAPEVEEYDPIEVLRDIRRQKEAIESNHFFQHLLLRDLPSSHGHESPIPKNSWLIEKTNQLQRRRSSCSEPSISAMKVYLKHTRPVSDSKFKSLDIASVRSRSASPKSVTFDENVKQREPGPKRSSSLPSKLVFSQTSRPVSPLVQHKAYTSPSPSPKLSRSPSSRKIMHLKNNQEDKKPHEYSLYMCPTINHSTNSLDSLKSEDYQRYFNEFLTTTKRSDKFKDLNKFYVGIEKLGQLEKKFCVKPRKKSEIGIIDYDRWKEVRTRERAEQELETLYSQIKENEKEKGFLYLPKDVNRYRWKRELDRGLRIKEKSVDDIKEEFEKIKLEEAEREQDKRNEMFYLKDIYKPLWRGCSVANMANSMIERRSQSEGRVKSARQKILDEERLLNHGIGSRIWSSLSMEQVNILKEQLAEIYNNVKKPHEDYSVQVPDHDRRIIVPSLTVRRNSDSSEQMYKKSLCPKAKDISENEKKLISQSLSKELLEKLAKYKKESHVIVGKEILGAVAAADANIKNVKVGKPPKPLVKSNVLDNNIKIPSISETESVSTDESTKTVIHVETADDIKKKVEYFEKARELETYTPTIYKAADEDEDSGTASPNGSEAKINQADKASSQKEQKIFQSKSCQSIKEYFGEKDLVKFATIPLSASRKQKFSPKKPELRSIEISPIRSEFSMNTSQDSLCRSRSSSPYLQESRALVKPGEVNRLKNKFEYWEDMYGNITLKRSRSESDLNKIFPSNLGYVDNLRRKYEYPAYSGRGRSRTRRGGVVSPVFLKAEDRFMPHINIISKIASLYSKQKNIRERQRSMEDLAELLGCPIGEVEKLREKFDSNEDISLVGHMYTSSPSIRELKDIAPYLTADWTAHKYPRYDDNTRSLSSPDTSVASRDTSLVRRGRSRTKSISPVPKSKKSCSILKPIQSKPRSTDFSQNQRYDPKIHEPVARYQPSDVSTRYRNGWSVFSKPSVSFKGVVFRFTKHDQMM